MMMMRFQQLPRPSKLDFDFAFDSVAILVVHCCERLGVTDSFTRRKITTFVCQAIEYRRSLDKPEPTDAEMAALIRKQVQSCRTPAQTNI